MRTNTLVGKMRKHRSFLYWTDGGGRARVFSVRLHSAQFYGVCQPRVYVRMRKGNEHISWEGSITSRTECSQAPRFTANARVKLFANQSVKKTNTIRQSNGRHYII